jgi:rhodanese-related sulfurtransferase
MSDEATTTTTSAEEISPQRAWQMLCEEPRAQLVDVRTEPEWTYVGMPDLGAVGKTVLRVSWHVFPSMTENEEFLTQLIKAAQGTDQAVLFLCRSGGRSLAAARAAMAAGFSRTASGAVLKGLRTIRAIADGWPAGNRPGCHGDKPEQ